jgi:hypothetical protein
MTVGDAGGKIRYIVTIVTGRGEGVVVSYQLLVRHLTTKKKF